MLLTLALPPDIERQIRQAADQQDADTIRALLAAALAAAPERTVLDSIQAAPPLDDVPIGVAEWDTMLAACSTVVPADVPPLTDEAVSRDGIYQDHP